jgi:hypothetical protein
MAVRGEPPPPATAPEPEPEPAAAAAAPAGAPQRTLVALGGWNGRYERLKSAEVLRLPGGEWAALPHMAVARAAPAAAATAHGDVFVCGGSGLRSAECYRFADGRWVALPDMASERSGAGACLLASGVVVVVGGAADSGKEVLATVEAFDPAVGGWRGCASMAVPRVNFGLAALPGRRRAVAAGGEGGGLGNILGSVEVYDAEADAWSGLPPMAIARYGAGCAALADGRVRRIQAHIAEHQNVAKRAMRPRPLAQGDTAILHCRWLSLIRYLHTGLAVIAVIFCRNDSVARQVVTAGGFGGVSALAPPPVLLTVAKAAVLPGGFALPTAGPAQGC